MYHKRPTHIFHWNSLQKNIRAHLNVVILLSNIKRQSGQNSNHD